MKNMASHEDNVVRGIDLVNPWKNKHDSDLAGKQQEADMSGNITKTEFEALLRANKSEVDVVAANIQKEMAEWREQQNTQMSQLNATLTAMSAKVDSRFEILSSAIGGIDKSLNAKIDGIDKSLNAKIDGVNGSLSGKIEGINTAISGIQSGISTKLTIFSVVIAGIIAMAGWWFSSNQPQSVPVAQQPIVVYAQQPAPAVQATPPQVQPAPQPVPQEPTPEPQKAPAIKQ
ncbi:hypothetical protein AB7X32_17610 [Morganella morganii]|uniref:hypothetical protein n=1 Tax=Morganella morganii TaxID=582 RepID=UPI0034E59F7C